MHLLVEIGKANYYWQLYFHARKLMNFVNNTLLCGYTITTTSFLAVLIKDQPVSKFDTFFVSETTVAPQHTTVLYVKSIKKGDI